MYFFQIHKLGRHDAAGRILGIFQVLVDEVARGRRRRAHDTLDHIGRQLLHHVDGVVNIQLFDDAGKLRIGDGVDDRLLLLDLEVGEHGRRDLLGQDTEHHGHPLRVILHNSPRNSEMSNSFISPSFWLSAFIRC